MNVKKKFELHSVCLFSGQFSSSVPSLQSLYPSQRADCVMQSPDSHRQVLVRHPTDLSTSGILEGRRIAGGLSQLNGDLPGFGLSKFAV